MCLGGKTIKVEEKGRCTVQNLWYLSVLFVLGLMAANTQAGERTVWILWEHLTGQAKGFQSNDWTPRGGHETKQQCETAARSEATSLKQVKREGAKITASETEVFFNFNDGKQMYYRYVCLPDTIDPRPKGKE